MRLFRRRTRQESTARESVEEFVAEGIVEVGLRGLFAAVKALLHGLT
ncbi:hypothetical protein ACIP5Y_02995 [Nocardia sp. NPDC088792]